MTGAHVSVTSAHVAERRGQVSGTCGHRFDDVCAGISRLGASAADLWPDGTALRAASRLPRLFANRWRRCPYYLSVKNRPSCQSAVLAIVIGASSALEIVPNERTNAPTSARDAAGRTVAYPPNCEESAMVPLFPQSLVIAARAMAIMGAQDDHTFGDPAAFRSTATFSVRPPASPNR